MRITQAEYDALAARGCVPALPKATKKSPYKSKAEQQFAWKLEDDRKAGEIFWWAYEPITLVIVDAGGKRCRYTPDFMIASPGELQYYDFEFIEVKGFLREAARIRFLAAREKYPFWKFTMVKKEGGAFKIIL
jgi:hypothetical protein